MPTCSHLCSKMDGKSDLNELYLVYTSTYCSIHTYFALTAIVDAILMHVVQLPSLDKVTLSARYLKEIEEHWGRQASSSDNHCSKEFPDLCVHCTFDIRFFHFNVGHVA